MSKINLAFYQPDIPQNVGAAMRLCACLDIGMHIIEPCGFAWKDNEFKRSGMDYRNHVALTKFSSWEKYKQEQKGRLILLTTKASIPYTELSYQEGDTLLLGRESVGVPEEVHTHVDERVVIPMYGQMRSLNVINSAAMVLGEALRQTGH
ncbi:MAG: tRNA (cytidine(34)-2'-O)-methyltransferase [Bdellovibrionales bacterium]